MANQLALAGAQAQKQTRFAALYTGRWSSGIWTNRSPLRDAATTRISEKYYGAAGDALIAGSNVEITPRLTLGRRPGNPIYDSNSYTNVDRFYDFRLFSTTAEQINVMVDQANALYSLYNGVKSLVWTKQRGAGQSYMQSVGNSLYWGDGVSNKKWLQTLTTWTANQQWNEPTTPFFSTFFIDPNGNIQQLTGTVIPVIEIAVAADVLTVISSVSLTSILGINDEITFPASMTAAFLENQTVTLTGVSGTTFTATFANPDYGPAAESSVIANEITYGATPISGSTQPAWSTVVPASSNHFQGGLTNDGTVQWTNRGNPVENWGIVNTADAIVPTVGTSTSSWGPGVWYSYSGTIIDSNGNLQLIIKAGTSGALPPTWGMSVGDITVDGSGPTAIHWQMIQTAASLLWQPHTAYTPSTTLSLTSVATASGGNTVYTGSIIGGASDAFVGLVFIISGFGNSVNNGTFTCTGSSLTQLTLNNVDGFVETNAGTAAGEGTYVIGNSSGTACLFELAPITRPSINGDVSGYVYGPGVGYFGGSVTLTFPTSLGSALASTTTQSSFSLNSPPGQQQGPIHWGIVNGAGEYTGLTNPLPAYSENFQLVILANLYVPIAGQYSFTVENHDGVLWGIGNGATVAVASGFNPPGLTQTLTVVEGYPIFGGNNSLAGGGAFYTNTSTVNFPTAGIYPIEIDWVYASGAGMVLQFLNGAFNISNGVPESISIAPVWPPWTTIFAPGYPSVSEASPNTGAVAGQGGVFTWNNLGPISDFTWTASTIYTLPNSSIIDPNGYTERPYRTGITGKTIPAFQTGRNQLTPDNPNLIWINDGIATSTPAGTVSTFNGGWQYGVALVNTLDNTVSNCSPLSASTGNFTGVAGIVIPAGAGIPLEALIDPQADYVAIFRTTDGKTTPFLIPGAFTTYTVPLAEYLVNGYIDSTPDTGLNNLIEGAIEGENTPPAAGAQNLTYHLNRIFYSIGNTVNWTTGPDTPVGNGINGSSPLDFDNFPSLARRLVPTSSGLMVFTVSDVYLIPGTGTSGNPIQSGIPIMEGVGLSSYNALDVNGSIIGFFTTDNQFCIIDPSAGNVYAGFPIGDQLRLNNGNPGQSWNPANVYVTWHVEGEDQGWYVADGQTGWFRLMPTPSPEQGYTWCPYATIVGGCKAVQSIEVSPGVHKLLLGPTGAGNILNRSLSSSQDNGVSYPAWAAIGSAVLAQPGQVAEVSFITTESVRTGTPLTLALLIDEALPYYTGPWETLKDWANDPPGLKESRSFYGQRFYLSEMEDEAAVCRHMQVIVQWAAEAAQNELTSLTIYGGYLQEN